MYSPPDIHTHRIAKLHILLHPHQLYFFRLLSSTCHADKEDYDEGGED